MQLTFNYSQVNSIGAEQGGDTSGGPLWGRFFGAAAGADDDDSESAISGMGNSESVSSMPFSTPSRNHRAPPDTPGSEVFPNDSASAVDDGLSEVGGSRRGPGQASSVGAAPVVVDDGTYLFKFVAPGGTTHRFQARYDSHDFITDIIAGKLASDPFFVQSAASAAEDVSATTTAPDPKDFKLSYLDDDGDLVIMTADRDVQDAVSVARKQGKDRVVIQLSGGKGWDDEITRRGLAAANKAAKQKLVAVHEEGEEEENGEKAEDEEEKPRKKRSTNAAVDEELVFGFLPKEHLLPASIGFLGVVIVAVFAASKAGGPGK